MNKKAFTLVELIVVITILAVLATVAFVSFQWYAVSARDSARLADIKSIEKILELYNVRNDIYPSPDSKTNITYSGATAWTQWVFGTSSYTTSSSMSDVPVDPVTWLEYAYSVTATRKEYQLAAVLETLTASKLTSWTYAWTQEAEVYVKWNYNGKFLKVNIGNTSYLLGVPTILSSDISNPDLLEIINNQQLVYKGHKNLPASFSGSVYKSNGWFDFTPAKITLFEWNIKDLEISSVNRVTFLDNLQTNYTGTVIESETEIAQLLSVDSTSSDESSNYVARSLNNSLKTNIAIVQVAEEVIAPYINEEMCISTNWIWVPENIDPQWNGFCISPMIWKFEWLSWNGWWTTNGWWDASSVIDSWMSSKAALWQTRILDTPTGYACKSIGTALWGYVWSDTLTWRMQWLTDNGHNLASMQNIDWITGALPPTGSIPALYLSDCLDGVKDLTTDMDTITYAQYSQNDTSNNYYMHSQWGQIYQDRQQYLFEWTNKQGSHLPSLFTDHMYIYSSMSNPSYWSGALYGEYSTACFSGYIPADPLLGWNQDTFVAAINRSSHSTNILTINEWTACWDPQLGTTILQTYSSSQYVHQMARIIVRP